MSRRRQMMERRRQNARPVIIVNEYQQGLINTDTKDGTIII